MGWTTYGRSVTACTLSGNYAQNGGGVFNDTGYASLTNCTLTDNDAPIRGGGLTLDTGTAVLTACTISGNTAGNNIGGGLDIVHPYDSAVNHGYDHRRQLRQQRLGQRHQQLAIARSRSSHDRLIGIGGPGGIANGSNGNIVTHQPREPGVSGATRGKQRTRRFP